jgi:hypothetical protein
MKRRAPVTRHGNLVRASQWHGVTTGDAVVVDGVKERRQHWVFVAHVLNESNSAKRGARLRGLSLAEAPQLPLH